MAAASQSTQPEGWPHLDRFRDARGSLAPPATHPPPLAQPALRRHAPEVGAVCGKAARTDLCGGRGVISVPTATESEIRERPLREPLSRSRMSLRSIRATSLLAQSELRVTPAPGPPAASWCGPLGEFHAEGCDAIAHGWFCKSSQKGLDGRTGTAAIDHQKIKMLRRDGQERQTVELRHIGDGDPPIGAALRDCGCDRVVRFRLIGVTWRSMAFEQLVDQDTGPGAGIAIDHQAG